jgi:hypothetical protein
VRGSSPFPAAGRGAPLVAPLGVDRQHHDEEEEEEPVHHEAQAQARGRGRVGDAPEAAERLRRRADGVVDEQNAQHLRREIDPAIDVLAQLHLVRAHVQAVLIVPGLGHGRRQVVLHLPNSSVFQPESLERPSDAAMRVIGNCDDGAERPRQGDPRHPHINSIKVH